MEEDVGEHELDEHEEDVEHLDIVVNKGRLYVTREKRMSKEAQMDYNKARRCDCGITG